MSRRATADGSFETAGFRPQTSGFSNSNNGNGGTRRQREREALCLRPEDGGLKSEDLFMGLWLGIDPGTRRVGVAAGNTDDGIASPLTAVPAGRAAEEIERLAAEYQAEGLVVGWPLNMGDTEGPQGRHARQFAAELARSTGRDVRLWDERLSSFAADQKLAGRLTAGKRKARRDALASAAMLEDFLARAGPRAAPTPASATPPQTRGD